MRTQTRIKIKSAMPRPVWNMISSAYRRNLYSRYKKDMTRHPDSMTVFCPCCGLKFREFVKGDYVRLFGINAGLFMEDAGFEVSVIDGKDCPEEVLPVTAPCKYDINRLFLCRKV